MRKLWQKQTCKLFWQKAPALEKRTSAAIAAVNDYAMWIRTSATDGRVRQMQKWQIDPGHMKCSSLLLCELRYDDVVGGKPPSAPHHAFAIPSLVCRNLRQCSHPSSKFPAAERPNPPPKIDHSDPSQINTSAPPLSPPAKPTTPTPLVDSVYA